MVGLQEKKHVSKINDGAGKTGYLHYMVVAIALTLVLIAGNIPTPLYVIFQDRFHFSDGMVTVIFVGYVIGVLIALILFGRLSDQIGRKKILLPALGLSAISCVLLGVAQDVVFLFLARLLSGVAVGLFNSAATASLVELEPHGNQRRASLTAAACTIGGIGIGPILAGILAPAQLVFLIVFVLLILITIGVFALPEPNPKATDHVSWRPQRIAVPSEIRAPFTVGSLCFACGFTAAALFLSLGPTLIAETIHVNNHAIAGGIVFLLFAVSAVTQLILRGRLPIRHALGISLVLVTIGLCIIVIAEVTVSLWIFIVATLAIGIGQGLSWDSSLALINEITPSNRRGEIAAAFYTVGYLFIGILIIALGLASNAVGLLPANIGFSAVVIIVAIASFIAVTTGIGHSSQGECPPLHP